MRALVARLLDILGSIALSIVLLGLLWVLTLIGTFEQAYKSLFDVQEEVFGSFIFVYERGPFPIPMPGAYLVLGLLCVNIFVGGMLRLRRGRATAGVVVAHIGIAMLLLGGFVEERWSTKGHVTLYESESADEVLSHTDWEVAIMERIPSGGVREYVIPQQAFEGLESGDVRRATHAGLPFELEMRNFMRNADVRRVPPGDAGGVDGYVLGAREPEKKAESNVAGLVVDIVERDANESQRALLWALQRYPYEAEVAGRRFEIDLRRRRWPLPFSVRLDRFVHEMHPGTAMPSRFSSYVTKTHDGVALDAHITMNEPLRSDGYTFYQSGWGPQNAVPGAPLFSTFSVIRNPSDRVPIAACVVIFLGLVWHFGRKLVLHLKSQARRASA